MTKEIKKAKLKTIKIKGKDYVDVHERIRHFRENYEGWSLTSEIKELTRDRIVIRASVKNNEGVEIASGLAYEDKDSSFINKTSFIENAETSAFGRALGCLGIGVETSFASGNEVLNAVINQNKTENKKPLKWFNENDFKMNFEHIKKMKDEGKDNQEILKRISEKFLISKDMKEKILNLTI